MVRETTARVLFALLAVALFALQLGTPTGTAASAHRAGQTPARAESAATSSVKALHDRADTPRDQGRPGEPAGLPHVRDRQRGSASGWAQEHPLIPGRAAEESSPDAFGTPRPRSPRAPGTPTPAALQVFRC